MSCLAKAPPPKIAIFFAICVNATAFFLRSFLADWPNGDVNNPFQPEVKDAPLSPAPTAGLKALPAIGTERTHSGSHFRPRELSKVCDECGLKAERELWFSKLHVRLHLGGIIVELRREGQADRGSIVLTCLSQPSAEDWLEASRGAQALDHSAPQSAAKNFVGNL
jgi:hypothetical protein